MGRIATWRPTRCSELDQAKAQSETLRQEIEQARVGHLPEGEARSVAELEGALATLGNEVDRLHDQVSAQIKAQNATRGSMEIVDHAVTTLRANADRLPWLNRYFTAVPA